MKNRCCALLLAVAFLLNLCACTGKKPGFAAIQQEITRSDLVTVQREPSPPALKAVNDAAALAVRQYVYARFKTEAFVTADFASMPLDKLAAMVDDLAEIWEYASRMNGGVEEIADQAITLMGKSSTAQNTLANKMDIQLMPLVAKHAKNTIQPLANDAGQKWAENLTAQYDAIKGGQTVKQLAKQLGVDAKSAYSQLVLAQDIIRSGAMADANFYDKMTKLAQATKTACKVSLFVTATIASGGGTLSALAGSSVTLAQGGALIVGGADCIVDVASTGSAIILGENHQVTVGFNDIKDYLAPVSAVIGLTTFNPAETGEQLAYIGDSLADWFYEGRILGLKVTRGNAGIKLEAQQINVTGKSETQAKAAIAAAGFLQPEQQHIALTSEQATKKDAVTEKYKIDNTEALLILDRLMTQVAAIAQAADEIAGADTDSEAEGYAVSGWPSDFYGVSLPAPECSGRIVELTNKIDKFNSEVTTIRIKGLSFDEYVLYCKTLEKLDGWISDEDNTEFPESARDIDFSTRFAGSYGALPRITVFYLDEEAAAEKGIPTFQMFVFKTF